ncbi:MAG: hypothetical protein GY795_42375 [Desulfobacterales bacterium]|nr:hypothetical protein [Desulfobacterales bacterium]
MEKRLKQRYLFAVYLLLAGVAICLLLLAKYKFTGNNQVITINIATNLLSVVLIFIFVNKIFLIDEWNISERLNQFIEEFNKSKLSTARLFFKKKNNISFIINESSTFDLCGVTLSSTLKRYKTELHNRLWKGAKIRILLISEDQIATSAAAFRSQLNTSNDYEEKLKIAVKDIEHIDAKWSEEDNPDKKGILQVKKMKYPPSMSIFAFNKNQADGRIFIEFFPHKNPDNSPEFQLDHHNDGEWYTFFIKQFEKMWIDAEWHNNNSPNKENSNIKTEQ